MRMLEVDHISVFYGGIHAIKDLSLRVEKGTIFTVIGANGAGKTTLLRAIMGLEKCAKGTVKFNGEDITSKPTFMRVKMGMGMVPEGRKLFQDLTVEENLALGAYIRTDQNEEKQDMQQMFTLFPVLRERRKQVAKTLSGGEQQMLAIGRALMSKPQLLLLDEPSMGLMPMMVNEIFKTIKELKSKLTILLVEQNAKKALEISDLAALLELGEVSQQGQAERLKGDSSIKKAYLGG